MDEPDEIAPGIVARDGKPYIKECKVAVEQVLRDLASGATSSEVKHRRGVSRAGQRAALGYAFEIMEDEVALVTARVLAGREAVEPAPGIRASPDIRLGKPVIAGTGLSVMSLLGHLAAGDSIDDLAEGYAVSRQAILDAIGYAAKIVALETVSAPSRR